MHKEVRMNTRTTEGFDQKAASWDDDPVRVKLARDISHSILRDIPLTPDMDVMDFGCGTGLIALQLSPWVRSVVGYDSSRGMLDVFKKKIFQQNRIGVEARFLDKEKNIGIIGQYHLIISSMTLHHVKDIKALLDQFYTALQPSGCLCIADLEVEDGKFHDNNEGIFHYGFDKNILSGILRKAGYLVSGSVTPAEVVKMGKDGIERSFSIFLLTAHKHKK